MVVLPTVPIPAPSGGAYMSKYSPYGVEEPIREKGPDDSRFGGASGRDDSRVMFEQEEEDYGMYDPYSKRDQAQSRGGFENDPDQQYFNGNDQDIYGNNGSRTQGGGVYAQRQQGYDVGAENFRFGP